MTVQTGQGEQLDLCPSRSPKVKAPASWGPYERPLLPLSPWANLYLSFPLCEMELKSTYPTKHTA